MKQTMPMNFSGGPGALPASVLRETSVAIDRLPETGLSVLGMSHRSDWFRGVLDEAERNLRVLLGIPGNYHVLFMQGGSSLQFSMLPMNFLRGSGKHAEYIVSGYWSAKAPVEGLEFADIPGLHEVPLVCDMSSNLLAAPLDIDRYAMIYAHAQKNLGPAGVTLVILRDEFAQRARHALP